MSNALRISVGNFSRLNQPDDYNVVVIAVDSYGQDVMTFDSVEHLLECYPTENDLIAAVLALPAFDDGAVFKADGTYELTLFGSVEVQGYPK